MKKVRAKSDGHEMRAEYDFSRGVRGRHYREYRRGHTVRVRGQDGSVVVRSFTPKEGSVMLDPDVKARFPNSQSVNRALRALLKRRLA